MGIDKFALPLSRGFLDTLTWSNPQTFGDKPCRRRAHTTCVYNNCIYVFGGGDGVQALNDTYKLDLTDLKWEEVKTTGQIPIARGYHTSNLIKSQFIVYGGSDGHECFSDVHVLDLGKTKKPFFSVLRSWQGYHCNLAKLTMAVISLTTDCSP